MRLTIVLVAAAALAASPPPARADSGKPVVELMTTSVLVSTEQLQAALPAFQTAVSRDLGPAWNLDATLIVGDPAHPVPADMTLVITDWPDCMWCGGYHWVTANGQPYAKVFPDDGPGAEAWTLVVTHELFEMLVDPLANRFARLQGKQWLVEVADPCESGFYAYFIGQVAVSDFVLPTWYQARGRGPFDFTGFFVRPGQVGRHGYASYLKPNGWGQVFG